MSNTEFFPDLEPNAPRFGVALFHDHEPRELEQFRMAAHNADTLRAGIDALIEKWQDELGAYDTERASGQRFLLCIEDLKKLTRNA
jgi:hypothetical protein